MKYSNGQNLTLAQVRVTLISEFKKPKSESQCIIELKEIMQKPTESIWEFDQKYSNGQNLTLAQVRAVMISEFKKPKSES